MVNVSYKQAQSRYIRVFWPVMVVYIVACFAGPALISLVEPQPVWLKPILAVFTAFPIAIVFWLLLRHVRETDEYTRSQMVAAILPAAAITLALTTFWGFMEIYGVVSLPERISAMFFVSPTFFAIWAVIHLINNARAQ